MLMPRPGGRDRPAEGLSHVFSVCQTFFAQYQNNWLATAAAMCSQSLITDADKRRERSLQNQKMFERAQGTGAKRTHREADGGRTSAQAAPDCPAEARMTSAVCRPAPRAPAPPASLAWGRRLSPGWKVSTDPRHTGAPAQLKRSRNVSSPVIRFGPSRFGARRRACLQRSPGARPLRGR
jgi:hypothetical protein